MFTQQHYRALAGALREARPASWQETVINPRQAGEIEVWTAAAEAIAGLLQADNPNFDRALFMRALDIEEVQP